MKFPLFAFGLGALLVAGCDRESVVDAEQVLCNELVGFESSLQRVASLTPDSSVDELRDASRDAQKAYGKVAKASEKVDKARTRELIDAYDDFENAVDDIHRDDTLSNAAAQVLSASAVLQERRHALIGELQCP